MVGKVERVFSSVKTRLYDKQKVYTPNVETLSDLFHPSYSFEEFKSEILSWEYSRIENQLNRPIFSIDYKKLDFLYRLVQVNGMTMPAWLSSYFA